MGEWEENRIKTIINGIAGCYEEMEKCKKAKCYEVAELWEKRNLKGWQALAKEAKVYFVE